jgi:hypothetical protein
MESTLLLNSRSLPSVSWYAAWKAFLSARGATKRRVEESPVGNIHFLFSRFEALSNALIGDFNAAQSQTVYHFPQLQESLFDNNELLPKRDHDFPDWCWQKPGGVNEQP